MGKEIERLEIVYTDHLKWRIQTRGISENLPKIVYEKSERHYYDIQRKHYIAISEVFYKGRVRSIMIAYDIENDVIEIITVHPIKEIQIKNRLETGRWITK